MSQLERSDQVEDKSFPVLQKLHTIGKGSVAIGRGAIAGKLAVEG